MSVIPGATALDLQGGEIAILMIHGFTGSTLSVQPWANALHQAGYSVRAPLLPGHGTRWEDLNQTRWQDWYQEVRKNFEELKSKHRRIFVAGFSMGGSLSIRLAAEYGDQVEGLILINPSVYDRRLIMKFVPVLKYFIPSVGGRGTDVARSNPPRHSYGRTPLKALHSLQGLWRTAQRDLHRIEQPLMIGYSPQDHVVDPANSELVIDNVSSIDIREVIFENSYHNVALDHDLELLVESSLAFITDVLSGAITQLDSEQELVDAEFDSIVSGLSLDESSPNTYLDELEANTGADIYPGDNKELPTLSRIQRIALIGVIGGPLYAVLVRFFKIDLLGLDIWPGLLGLLGGVLLFFWQMRPEPEDEDGVAL